MPSPYRTPTSGVLSPALQVASWAPKTDAVAHAVHPNQRGRSEEPWPQAHAPDASEEHTWDHG
eukprot:2774414-Prorocentrum_lima.AAC.1